MALYLIRCARAERRSRWEGPDDLRPLTEAGRAQAAALAEWFGNVAVSHVASSPFTRCVETVQPLADAHDLEVEQLDSLAPTKDVEPILAWLRVIPDNSVLCSHGAVIARVMEILTRQGAELDGSADWRKGATWVLERTAHKVLRASTVPPGGERRVLL
jgi:phosphohistidine phosphatase SixA